MNRQYAILIDRIEASSKELLSYFSRLPADEIMRVPAPGEWSAHAIAAHLRDTERHVFVKRTERILRQAEPPFVENFDQEQWNRDHYSPAEPFKKILGEFRAAQRQFLKLLRASTDKDWPRFAIHPEYGKISIEWLATHNYAHMLEHLHQMLMTREAEILKRLNNQ